jgi:hypothetical protein
MAENLRRRRAPAAADHAGLVVLINERRAARAAPRGKLGAALRPLDRGRSDLVEAAALRARALALVWAPPNVGRRSMLADAGEHTFLPRYLERAKEHPLLCPRSGTDSMCRWVRIEFTQRMIAALYLEIEYVRSPGDDRCFVMASATS